MRVTWHVKEINSPYKTYSRSSVDWFVNVRSCVCVCVCVEHSSTFTHSMSFRRYVEDNVLGCKLFMHSRECFDGVYFTSCETTREIDTTLSFSWMHKQFVTTVHTWFDFLHDMINTCMTLKHGLHTSSPCLTSFVNVLLKTSQSIADDVKMQSRYQDNRITGFYLSLLGHRPLQAYNITKLQS